MPTNPIASLGDAGLLLALIGCAYAVGACVAGARRSSSKLVRSGVLASYAATGLICFSSALMWFAISSNDYSIKYVAQHTDAAMPWYYKITAFWGGLEGSIVWWVLLLAVFASIAIYVNRERHRELIPYVTAVLYVVIGFFLFLIIFEKRPFDVFLTSVPRAGKGLNPLLQNPYMATHPPSLYLGFVSATVPFSFGVAALVTGNLDDSWIQSTRRWMLLSWYFLGQGLILGMLWAYEELGWGGYWGWDPVENAGFLPWLTATAFLHSIMIQERRGMMKVWNVSLVITTFLLTVIGTFMTRSGIVQSVHAFGQDNELAVIFLCFIFFTASFSFGYVIHRLPLLRSRNELDSWLSREFVFLLNNWILLGAAFFILTATLFPTLSEAIMHERITVGPPFFTKWMAPLGLVLLFLTAVGPLIAWRKASVENLKQQFTWPVVVWIVSALVLGLWPGLRGWMTVSIRGVEHRIFPLTAPVLCFSLCAFSMATIVQEFYRGARVRQVHTKLDFFTSMIGLVARNKKRYGGYLVHAALVLMFVGFAGDAYKHEKEVTLERGQTVTLGRYTARYDGLNKSADPVKEMITATLTVTVNGQPYAVMHPAKWSYRHHEDEPPTTEVDIHKTLREDYYTILNGFEGETANIKVVINPLVDWIWLGFLLLAGGTVIAFMPDRAYALAAARDKSKAAAAATTAALLVLLGLGGVAHAQNADKPMAKQSGDPHYARSDREQKLFARLRCLCGTCQDVLSNCACSYAPGFREYVQQLIDAGKSDDEIYLAEVGKFGQQVLTVPLDQGFNRLAWLVPIGALLGGVGVLVTVARRWTRHPAPETAPPAPTVGSDAKDAEYDARLDDELDELD